MDQKKKMAAVIAAVTAYIQTEEEALCLQGAVHPDDSMAAPPPAPTGPANLWGLSGRQSLMQMGNMMQMKAFHRS
ncbi:MAG: hypothetical protein KQI78_00420 [Deltaproteobacteria bacterium]|jgi:hypothetical protein|nr:hypothetical protein [Deltaproteobacteria bacterium]